MPVDIGPDGTPIITKDPTSDFTPKEPIVPTEPITPSEPILPVDESGFEPAKEEEVTSDTKTELLFKMQQLIVEYGGESNIPHSSEYWTLLNQYRGLISK